MLMELTVPVAAAVIVSAVAALVWRGRRAVRPPRARAGRSDLLRYPGRRIAVRPAGAPMRTASSAAAPDSRTLRVEEEASVPVAALADGRDELLSTMRIGRPIEATVQVLPGRLEVVEGPHETEREIRFVRSWGDTPEITIGRGAGPRHRHARLRSVTVSRAHARMRFEGERWKLTNLSETNPTVVNGEVLALHASRLLEHGDRLELGEVVLRYWDR
jgi:hypothetical protein